MKVRFFTLLGVGTPAAAAERWPNELLRPFVGQEHGDTSPAYEDLMIHLQDSLEFRAVRPGADADRTGISAQLFVIPSPLPPPISMVQFPELAFYLKPTGDLPATVFVTVGRTGREIVIHGLPVEIQFPIGMIQPLYTDEELAAANGDPPDKHLTPENEPFDPNRADSVEIIASDWGPTRVTVRINVRLTETDDFLFDTAVPVSIGPCAFSGLPCRGLHDIQLIPTPKPQHVPHEQAGPEIALEWARRDISIDDLDAYAPGLISIRTVDFDSTREPLKGWFEKIQARRSPDDPVELVLEDLVLPLRSAPPLPIPTHGRISLRRSVILDDTAAELYDLHATPVEIDVRGTVFKIFRMMLQVPAEGELPVAVDVKWIDAPDDALTPELQAMLSVTDTGDVTLAATYPDPPTFLRILGAHLKIGGAKIGVSLKKIAKYGDPDDPEAGKSFFDVVALLGDFLILTGEQDTETFQLRDASGKSTAKILHDVGWAYGSPSLGSLYDPDGIDIALADALRLTIDEVGLVTENNGGLYVMVSASLRVPFGEADKGSGGGAGGSAGEDASASRDDSARKGFGLRLVRLRIRIARSGDNQPKWLLDGVSLFLRTKTFELGGFGMLSEYDRPPDLHYKELGIGITAKLSVLGRRIEADAQYLHGTVSRAGVEAFDYLLIAGSIGGVPLGATRANNVRALYASNMMPVLDPPDGHGQPMRLYRWYRANGDAISLPLDRKLQAWQPQVDARALGVGLTLMLAGTDAIRFDGFLFGHSGGGESGLLAGFELYFAKAKKPIAFAVIDWDFAHDKYGLMAGLALGLDNVLGDDLPSFLADLAALSGTIFYGNKPDTLAIGQYNDQSTWLQFRFQFATEHLNFGIFAGFCHHRVDVADALDPTAERINVWAFALSVKGGGSLEPLAKLQAYATLVFVAGQWRNEGMATGHQLTVEAGIRCKVLHCFNFGAQIKIDVAALGPGDPAYHRKTTVIRIETPWFLPDVTVRWERTHGTAVPEAMTVVSMPLVAATARRPVGAREEVPVGTTRLAGDLGAGPTYELRRLRDAAAVAPTDADFAMLPTVGVDSELMLDFAASCDAAATVLPSTTDTGGGTQQSNDLRVRYEVIEVGIRRRRRFGDPTWHDLIDPVTTNLDSVQGLPPDQLVAHFQSQVTFDWDPDLQRVGRVDPRRLMVNAVTPYSFSSSNPEGDEVVAGTLGGWPCCVAPRRPVRWHVVAFDDTPLGVRAPAVEAFTQSASTWHWIGGPPPLVVPPVRAPAGTQVVSLAVGERTEGVIATASFSEPVALVQIFAYWSSAPSETRLVVDAYRGLALIATIALPMNANVPPAPIVLNVTDGATSLLLRKEGNVEALGDKGAFAELAMVRFRTMREIVDAAADLARCGAQDTHVHGQGRLAWLPNCDYEITVRTRVTLGYTAQGDQDGVIEQKAYFRTQGLVGLNAVARVGDEVDPYVESQYPRAGDLLYRTEPLAIAFDERFDTLVPVDRSPSATDPEERQQLVEFVLAVDKIGGAEGLERITQTGEDWIVAHRGSSPPLPLPPRRPQLISDANFSTPTRQARTNDAFRLRLEGMMTRPGGCADPVTLHTSQVLVHQPVDPGHPDANPPRWEPGREYRVNLRAKAGPFVDRPRFEPADATAFARTAESGVVASWTVDDGALHVASTPPTGDAQLALFGQASGWEHVQVRTSVDPEGAQAGLAVAVSGASAARAIYALVDERGGAARLAVVEHRDGVTTELAAATLPPDTPKPYVLECIAFDDRVRAIVADVVVESGERDDVRSGRLALVAIGGGRFSSLAVTSVDAWRTHFHTSRYDDFATHIGSFGGSGGTLDAGGASANVADLLAQDSDALAKVMTPVADSEARERLFGQWVGALALPLREAPRALTLTRWLDGASTQLLVVESPEPLAFSRDVSLNLRRKLHSPPWPPHGGPADLADFIDNLEFGAHALAVPARPPELAALHSIVRAVRTANDIVYEVYSMPPRKVGAARIARPTLVAPDAAPAAFAAMAPDEVGLVDTAHRLLRPPFPVPALPTYVIVPIRILSNGDERRALVIPVGMSPAAHVPFAAGAYELTFAIDRARWRTATPDDASNYRASATLSLAW